MSWQDLTGKRISVNGEVGRVVHVDLLRVVLRTEAQDGVPARRLVVSPDEELEVEVLDDSEN